MKLSLKKVASAFLCVALSITSVGCTVQPIITTTESSTGTEETKETKATKETTTEPETTKEIPVMKEQPNEPKIELTHFKKVGLILDTINIGNLRDAPTLDGNIVGRFYPNTGMEILGKENGWYHISSGGIDGFVAEELVATGSKAVNQAIRYENYWVSIKDKVADVYRKKSQDSEVTVRVKKDQNYRVLKDCGKFLKIDLGKKVGYILAKSGETGYTVTQAENWNFVNDLTGNAQKMISFGLKYLGLPYVYGGESLTTGCDCSYFTGMCMAQVGVHVGRTSLAQSGEGIPVGSIAEAVPGDLLFYATHGSIDHVAIYIGDHKILHAAASIGCVSISAYNYCGEPVKIRRYF